MVIVFLIGLDCHSQGLKFAYLKRQYLQSICQATKTCAEPRRQLNPFLINRLYVVEKPVDEDDLIFYIISGINLTFHAFVTSYSFDKFQIELLNYEMLINKTTSIIKHNHNS